MSMSDQREHVDAPLTLERMRQDVAERLGLPPERVGDDDDLLRLGLDSIGLMRLAAAWSRAGAPVTFAELIEHRTLGEWWRLADTTAAVDGRNGHDGRNGSGSGSGSAAAEVDEAAPFPLATMQHAYWVGRTDGQVLGGVGAHFYNEFDGRGVDPVRLERAVHALFLRHPMLRCRFLDDGTQQIMAEPAWSGLAVRDLRGLPDGEVAEILARVRDEKSHRRLDVASGEVFEVSLSLLPGGATRVHVKIEMLVADAHSFRVLLADLAALYLRPDAPPPPISYSYPRYLADVAALPAAEHDAAREYWLRRVPELPGGPDLPVATPPERITSPTVGRRFHWVSPEDWERLSARAREHGVTLSMVFLTAFAEVLAAWSARQRFVLNLPLYDRRPLHPEVPHLVGDFTNLLLLEVDAEGDRGFAERARDLQERFARDVRHSAYSGVEVLRDLARAGGGEAVLAPVVFTSALSLGELFGPDVRDCFGAPGWTM
uniref:condensation domain-containing protein n=1 Tax=Sphaerimonospora mesophila TaxID=37483 RepID=UPI000B116776